MSAFKLTVVVDNQGAEGLETEHGYSLHIETPSGTILLDTGQKDALSANCETLGINLHEVSALVLSHGHYDHTGGVPDIIRHNREVDIYLHSGAFHPRYSLDGTKPSMVRMPLAAMEAVMNHDHMRVHWLTRPMSPFPGVGITGPIARNNAFEDTGGSFYLDPEGKKIDTIKDDVALWLHGKNGLVICLGCCHSGLLNTLEYITARTGEKRIDTIIGGMHLLHADNLRLEKTAVELGRYTIGRIIACHCSGETAVEYLDKNLACDVSFGYAGLRLSFG